MFENISNKNLLTIRPEQMQIQNHISTSNTLLNFNPFVKDNFQTQNISFNLTDNSSLTPIQQLTKLGQKYNIPFDPDIKSFQKRVIKALVMHRAMEYGIPMNIALGISGNESSWSMWKDVKSGKLEQCKNMREGALKSSDWGAMQINDKAHSKAFPRVKNDLEYNVEYGLKFLANRHNKIKGDMGLGFGEWDRTIASYNLGHNPSSQRDYEIAQKYVSRVKQKSLKV
ncbi:MAG: transglycosylase SLT domain-containing protein [Candidatus Sericytochromatia bacterium]